MKLCLKALDGCSNVRILNISGCHLNSAMSISKHRSVYWYSSMRLVIHSMGKERTSFHQPGLWYTCGSEEVGMMTEEQIYAKN